MRQVTQVGRHVPIAVLLFLTALAFAAAPMRAQTALTVTEIAESSRDDLEAASLRNDPDALAGVQMRLERALVAYPDDPTLQHYLGYAHYRIASTRIAQDGDAAGRHLEAAQDHLEHASKGHDWPETYALLASVYGMRIGSNMIRGMTLGPKADGAMDRAHELGEGNPRVWLLNGTSTLYKPRMFGGGVNKAIDQLTKSLDLFDADEPAPPRPNWGRAEIHAWLGVAQMQAKAFAAARASFAAALEIEPDYAWVSEVLLPGLDRTAPGR